MPTATAAMASSPPSGAAKMKQSVLSFKPRVSSGLASGPSSSSTNALPPIEPIPARDIDMEETNNSTNDTRAEDSDDEMNTPSRGGSHFSTPPTAEAGASRILDGGAEDDDEDDLSDLSDAPPVSKTSVAQGSKKKAPTKKRPSIALSAGSPNASSSSIRSTSSSRITPVGKKVPKENGEMRKTALPGEGPLCHQHRALCATEQIRCTFMRKPTVRCGLKFCAAGLEVQYNDSLDAIKQRGRNVTGVNFDEHCPASEANYIFKCPRCSEVCTCSICRKKFGVEPVRVERPPAASASKQKAPSKGKSKAAMTIANGKQKASGSSSGGSKTAATGKQTKAAQASAAGKKVAASSKASSSLKAALTSKGQALPAAASKSRQATLPRPIKPPPPVAAPELEVIKTALKPENVWARVWIYETLVRFDFIRVPKAILTQLDKFDLWTHRQVQVVLERTLAALAGLSNINTCQPKARYAPAIKAWREFGEDLQRGEPWQAAKDLVAALGHEVPELPHVERVFADESKEAAMDVDAGPTLLGSRSTRTRRAAELRAIERVKQQSLYSYESQFTDGSEEEEDELDHKGSGRDEWDGDADSEEDEMPRRGGRTSARQAAAASSSSAPEGARRSGRQADAARVVSSSSTRGRRIASDSMDNTPNRSRTTSTLTDSDSEMDDGDTGADDTRTSTTTPPAAPAPPKPAEPIPAPEMEEKVAILTTLLEAVLDTPQVNEELKGSGARLNEIERSAREDLKQLDKEWEEEKKLIASSAPSMSKVEDFAKWKKDKEKKERNHKLKLLDVKMNALRESEANKIRTGPLGIDADGRSYWQLTEFNEVMPRDTHGRWAWCVVVYGEPLVRDAPPPEAMPGSAPNVSPVKATVASASEEQAQDDDVKPVNGAGATSKGESTDKQQQQQRATSTSSSGSDLTPPPPAAITAPPGPVFMGTNYPPSISQVISFLKYRAAQREYEENRAVQEAEIAIAKEKAAAGATSPDASGASGSGTGGGGSPTKAGNASSIVSRKAKKQLKETQEARKKQVEALCKRLATVREYYLWHTGEPDDEVVLGEELGPRK